MIKVSKRNIIGRTGAEVVGVDLTKAVAEKDNALFAAIYDAFLAHHVLVFRNQDPSPTLLVAVAKQFGEISPYPFAKGMDDFPEITEIVKEPEQTSNFGGMWHSDTTYLPEPPKCTVLYAVQTPPRGLGDTLFSDMHRVYDSLGEDLRVKLEGLRAIQSSTKNAAVLRGAHLSSGSMIQTKVDASSFEASHPVIRTHPETNQKALFVNPSHTVQFEGQSPAESNSVLQTLFAKSIEQEFVSRISWESGTLVVWDNRCLIHCAVNDYNGHRRVMRRITITGDKPR